MVLLLDHSEPRLDRRQSGPDGAFLGLELDLSEAKHAPQLIRADLVDEELTHLVESEAKVLEGHETVEDVELLGIVGAVAAAPVNVRGLQQPDRVIVTQHANRYLTESGEVSDLHHDSFVPADTV